MASIEQKTLLSELYIAFFNRAPDKAGFEYWVKELDKGVSYFEIASNWWNSQAETKAKYPFSSNSDFIDSIYNNILGRATDADGKAYWLGELSSGHVTRDNFIITVLQAANAFPEGSRDRDYLYNKAIAGVYMAEKGVSAENAKILSTIDEKWSSVEAAKVIVDRNFLPAYDDLIKNHQDSIQIKFDSSMPESERQAILDYHTKITAVLDAITGQHPNQTFTMIYDPVGHRSWNPDVTVLKADKLPSQDAWFKSWYTVEVAHEYFKPSSDADVQLFSGCDNALRYSEYNSQALTSIIATFYGSELGFTDIEKKFYSTDYSDVYSAALEQLLDSVDVFSIYQTNTNYKMNTTAITAATHDILSMYKMDSNFYKNLLSKSWSSYSEFKTAVADSITTLSHDDAVKYVNGLDYFKQIDEVNNRKNMTLEIALFSSTDVLNTTSNKQFALDTPDSYIIFGQSNNIADNLVGTAVWDIKPDTKLYDSTATVTITDSHGATIYNKSGVDIMLNFDNSRSDYISSYMHSGESYVIHAEATVNGVLLTDDLSFTYVA